MLPELFENLEERIMDLMAHLNISDLLKKYKKKINHVTFITIETSFSIWEKHYGFLLLNISYQIFESLTHLFHHFVYLTKRPLILCF